jgi:hypothetical protein
MTKEEKVKYNRAYYEANKEKELARQAKYYKANKEKISAQRAKHYKANKEEISAQKAKYYEANKEGRVAYSRAYYEANKEGVIARTNKYREASPERLKAHRAVITALRNSSLVSLPCSECGETKTEAHHYAYDMPLDVIWLCRKHHMQLHKEHREYEQVPQQV